MQHERVLLPQFIMQHERVLTTGEGKEVTAVEISLSQKHEHTRQLLIEQSQKYNAVECTDKRPYGRKMQIITRYSIE